MIKACIPAPGGAFESSPMAITVPLMMAAEVKSVQKAVCGVANGAGRVKNAVPLPSLDDDKSGSKSMMAS